MKFIREIPTKMLPANLLDLEQEGFTLVWKVDSVELWAEIKTKEHYEYQQGL